MHESTHESTHDTPHAARPHIVPAPANAASAVAQPAEPHTIVATVRPRDGALERIFGVLRRRAPALTALNVSAGEGTESACVTATFSASRATAEQVAEQIRKLVDVDSVECFPTTAVHSAVIVREFALIRMRSDPQTRREIVDVVDLFGASIVEVRDGGIIIEASGDTADIDSMLAMLRPLGVEAVTRSGRLAMRKTDRAASAHTENERHGATDAQQSGGQDQPSTQA